jgi:hypothetical protein
MTQIIEDNRSVLDGRNLEVTSDEKIRSEKIRSGKIRSNENAKHRDRVKEL